MMNVVWKDLDQMYFDASIWKSSEGSRGCDKGCEAPKICKAAKQNIKRVAVTLGGRKNQLFTVIFRNKNRPRSLTCSYPEIWTSDPGI